MENNMEIITKEMRSFSFLPYYDETKEERYLVYKLDHPEKSWDEVFTHVGIGLDYAYYTKVHQIKHPDTLVVLVNKYRQLSKDYIPADLEAIDSRYNEGELLLRHDARVAFEYMCNAAQQEGIRLKAISTYRSYHYQNLVYFKNYSEEIPIEVYQQERDRVSARAGHSEHQTGLAVDINELEQSFEETEEAKWLFMNAYKYGFILRYPKGKEKITGYDYEPWHYRYLGYELSKAVYYSGYTYDEFYIRESLTHNKLP
jgi:D-alanyl-D-alanine carboxypeptidase